MMRYVSTRGGGAPLSFTQAVLAGLARDGGLYLPETIPDVSGRLAAWRGLPYPELAFEVMRLFADDIPGPALREIVAKSYAPFRHPETAPVVTAGPVRILELFHGPTLAFKDIALQFLGNLFEHALSGPGAEMNIVAATSGDTGSAAIHGVRGRRGIRIFVMHPRGRVSPVQERQMTTVPDANVFNLAVEGSFDDCQAIVKRLFNDLPFRDECRLGAVNSINWARILAQTVYYFYAAFRVREETGAGRVRFSVPTGNFGDIFAGYLALRMGLPVETLILAANANDILPRYFESGVYQKGAVVPTLSPSMDIQVASNFERYLYYLSGEDPRAVARWMAAFRETGSVAPAPPPLPCFRAGRCTDEEALATIRAFWERHGYLMDPHTAAGVSVGLRMRADSDAPLICLATAHPAKFGAAIRRATGKDLARHPAIDALEGLPARVRAIPADAGRVAAFIRAECGKTH